MRAPGAQGQPGDMTEVDQSGVEGLSSPHPHPSIICRLEKQRQDSTERAAAFVFSNPPSPPVPSVSRVNELTLLWTSSPSLSAVFKVHNMQLDLCTG